MKSNLILKVDISCPGGRGGGVLGSSFAGYVPLASQNPNCYMLCLISFNVAQLLQYTRLNIASVHRLFVLDIM